MLSTLNLTEGLTDDDGKPIVGIPYEPTPPKDTGFSDFKMHLP